MKRLALAVLLFVAGCGSGGGKVTSEMIAEAIRKPGADMANVVVNGKHLFPDKTEFDDRDVLWYRYAGYNGYVWVAKKDGTKSDELLPDTIQFSTSGKRE